MRPPAWVRAAGRLHSRAAAGAARHWLASHACSPAVRQPAWVDALLICTASASTPLRAPVPARAGSSSAARTACTQQRTHTLNISTHQWQRHCLPPWRLRRPVTAHARCGGSCGRLPSSSCKCKSGAHTAGILAGSSWRAFAVRDRGAWPLRSSGSCKRHANTRPGKPAEPSMGQFFPV